MFLKPNFAAPPLTKCRCRYCLLLTILPNTLNGYDNFKESVETGWFYELLAILCCRSRPNGKYKDCTSADKVSKELRSMVKDEKGIFNNN
jgi:hypothetical protein